MVNLFLTIIRALFALLDTLVVWLIKNLYVLLVQIANTNVFGSFIYQMLGRIYVFLGIFMLFKLTMSMITYIVNPDALTDKSKGFSKLITNVVISLILIVTVPSIFREAYRLQALILNSNAVYQIVTGRKVETNGSADSASDLIKIAENVGDEIAKGVFSSFVYQYQDVSATTDASTIQPPQCDDVDGCVNSKCTKASCYVAVSTVTLDGGGEHGFANEYKFLLSTICGAVVAYFFLVFCLDAAVRAIKLGMLQIIAPIPILSMIDPKGGNDKLKKWASICGKEYAGLFIRLAGVYFSVSVIQLVMGTLPGVNDAMTYYDPDGTFSTTPVGFFVKLFIIIGALMFAKQLPQFIEQVLGVKLSGGDGFNLKKRFSSMPGMGLAKMAGAGALGFAGGMAANTLAARRNFGWDKNKGFWKNIGHNAWGGIRGLGSAAAGGVSGLGRGAFSKEKSMWKAGAAGVKGAVDKRNLRDQRQESGYHIGRRTADRLDQFAGIPTGADMYDKQMAAYDAFLKEQSGLDGYVEGEIMKGKGSATTSFSWTNVAGQKMRSTGNVNVLRQQVDSLRANGASAVDIQNAEYAYKAALKQAKIDYVNNSNDNTVSEFISNMNYIKDSNSTYEGFSSMGTISTGEAWDSSKGTIKGVQASIKSSDKYRRAQANKKQK